MTRASDSASAVDRPPAVSAALVLIVALGAAVGGVGRWAAGELWPDHDGFATTTLLVNAAGCLALGVASQLACVTRRTWAIAFVGPGLLGGFTTFSAWSVRVVQLLADDRVALAASYAVGTLALCLLAAALGAAVGRRT